ncbi:MAG: ribosome recycling factor [Parcubacteria group bacterium]|nr:ribosome recycling factor [Parcubacteria group bacterium]
MEKELLVKTRQDMGKALDFFVKELSKVRTSHASPAMVEDIQVTAFSQKMVLKQLASISCPEPRSLLIQPWDRSYLEPIEKALFAASMGASPIVDKDTIRLSFPPLTEEFRKSLAKAISMKAEEARKTIRKCREDAWDQLQNWSRTGTIREDAKFKGKDELQKFVDEYQGKIESLKERKIKELQG